MYDIKNGENVVICKNKRHFRDQRTKIGNPATLEHNLTYVADIMLILFKKRKYAKKTCFSNIFDQIHIKNLKTTLNLLRALDWCMNCQYEIKYFFFTFL